MVTIAMTSPTLTEIVYDAWAIWSKPVNYTYDRQRQSDTINSMSWYSSLKHMIEPSHSSMLESLTPWRLSRKCVDRPQPGPEWPDCPKNGVSVDAVVRRRAIIQTGSRYSRLTKMGFVKSSDYYAFGFLDPAHVIRGCKPSDQPATAGSNDDKSDETMDLQVEDHMLHGAGEMEKPWNDSDPAMSESD